MTDTEVEKGHNQWRNPELRARGGATRPSVLEGVEAAISAWVAEECNRVLGQDLAEEGEELHTNERELSAWKRFEAFKPLQESGKSESVGNTRWAPTWRMVAGMENARACLAAKGHQDPV